MPVKTNAAQTYKTVHIKSVPIIAIGKSLCGFFVSSAAVETASKPIYAKKIIKAPEKIPSIPFGANVAKLVPQFSGAT